MEPQKAKKRVDPAIVAARFVNFIQKLKKKKLTGYFF